MRGIQEPLFFTAPSACIAQSPTGWPGSGEQSWRFLIVGLNHHLLLRLHEGVGNFLAAISGRNEDN